MARQPIRANRLANNQRGGRNGGRGVPPGRQHENRVGAREERPGLLGPEEGGGAVEGGAAPNAQRLVDSTAMRFLGLSLVGFDRDRQNVNDLLNSRRFRAFYGMGEQALTCLYNDLIPRPDATKFLMTVNWLKLYDTEHVLAGRWGVHENTLRPILSDYSTLIQGLKESKVVWGDFDEDEVFIVSVDGVHCQIQEVRRDPGAKWYSHKSNGPGLAYELGIAIRSNRLVWINGPFPASRHDITIFRSDDNPDGGLKSKIPDGKRAIGDSGYKGEPTKVAVTRAGDSDEVKKFKARARSRHETFNARIKSFKILDTEFRHQFERHKTVFEAVCICVQYDIENGKGLFEI
jgi:hypothetical protein